ncbi:MAG: thioredoxin family protein [Kiritimatiellae bacterium]|jgi:protein disulfide-isomerase|nr:thioredoxin family protein [Kiritimatiellia bacterium]
MQKRLILIGLALIAMSCTNNATKTSKDESKDKKVEETKSIWTTYSKAALDKAKKENKYILMDFTGSDWCGWCIKLDKEVFSKPEFITYATNNLVCIEVDFPSKKKLSPEQKKINDKLAQDYGVRGFPTIYILKPDGKTVAGKTGYQAGGSAAYVKHLQDIIKKAK